MNNKDLISRQTAIDKLFEYAESKFQSGEIELANGILKAKCFLESPCNIPTAYNVDKVIEEIEEWTARINVINDKSGKTGQVDVIGSNKAIKIVEGGGVSGDN